MELTAQDIHEAYCAIRPDESRKWDEINLVARQTYEDLAEELNKRILERLPGKGE